MYPPYFNLNPINTFMPLASNSLIQIPKASSYMNLLSPTVKKFTWTGLFNSTQKTLTTINQIIPIYNQIKPMISNGRTFLKVFRAINDDTPSSSNEEQTSFKQAKNDEKDIIDIKDIEDTFNQEEKVIIKEDISKYGKPFFVN